MKPKINKSARDHREGANSLIVEALILVGRVIIWAYINKFDGAITLILLL